MASIRKIEGKNGISYKITVSLGRDAMDKQIRHYKTWKPDKPMTARQMEKEVQRVAYEFERSIELGYQLDNRQTFSEYAEYFINLKARRGAAEKTLYLYRYFMERIGQAIGHMKLQDIRPQHLNNFYQSLEAPGVKHCADKAFPKVDFKRLLSDMGVSMYMIARDTRISTEITGKLLRGEWVNATHAKIIAEYLRKKPLQLFRIERVPSTLSPETVRRFHSFLYAVLSQAEKEMIILYNPAAKATPPQRGNSKMAAYFQPDELRQILKAADTEPIEKRALIYFLAVTGCRIGEALGLKWDKVSFEKKQIKIDSSLHYLPERGAYDGPTKTKNTRSITLPQEMLAIMRKARVKQDEQRLKMGDQWKGSGYVFSHSDGTPIIPGSVNGWLNRFSARHGLPHISPHMFRHTAASIMIANGIDVVTVSKMLGHSNTSTTTDVYSHAIEEAKQNAAKCIADVILKERA